MARRIGNETGDDEITTPVLRSSSTSIDSMDMSTTSPPSCNQTPSKTIPSSCSSFLPHSESNELRVAENTSCDVNLASRKANESAARRFQAASWLHNMVGPLPDLPREPSEEELRLSLRNGLVLCNLINKIHPGAVLKIVENPAPSSPPPQGVALSAYQYFENVRNFLVAVKELNLPSFQASDLDNGDGLQTGSSSARVVDCILALKAYQEWQLRGGHSLWKFVPNKSPCSLKSFTRLASAEHKLTRPHCSSRKPLPLDGTNKDLFDEWRSPLTTQKATLGHSRGQSADGQLNSTEMELCNADFTAAWEQYVIQQFNDATNIKGMDSLEVSDGMPHTPICLESVSTEFPAKLIILALHDKKPEEVPVLVEAMFRKVLEESKRRLSATQSKRNHKAMREDLDTAAIDQLGGGDHANLHDLKVELEEAQKVNQRRANILESQQKELKDVKQLLESTRDEIEGAKEQWRKEMEAADTKLNGLAQAAAEYHKVVAENRELYNQVQDLKGNIRVYCRVRPFLPGQSDGHSTVDFVGEKGSIMIAHPNKQGKDQRKLFKFNKVFGPTAGQGEVFLDTQPLIRSVLDGFKVCIFAYGQTGSGKTFTMTGPNNPSPNDWGVNFRALNDLFQLSQKRDGFMKYEVGVQMMEIYNEQVRDLLCSDGSNKKLEIRNNSQQNGLNVPDATMLSVKCTEDVMEFMNLGHKNRAVGSTALNDRSSRSHSVLTVHVKGTDLGSGAILRGCLHLVDLAGSERVDKSEVTGDRLKEAQHINKSLSALGDVIAALAQKTAHVPYRNSKLTQLLQDSLGGQAKTLMFVHVSPDEESYSETVSTLKFAERVATVELGAAQSHKESGEVRDLKDQIAFLKDVLAKKDVEVEKTPKEMKIKPIDSVHEKGKLKFGSSPGQLQQRRTSGEFMQQQMVQIGQGKRRQPLEEVRNSDVRPSPLNINTVQKHASGVEMSSPSVFDNNFMDEDYVKQKPDEDSCKRKAVKLPRQASAYSEQLSSPGQELEVLSSSRLTSKNKIRRESSLESPMEKGTDIRESSVIASTPAEKFVPEGVTMVFNSGRKDNEDRPLHLQGSHLKHFSKQVDMDSPVFTGQNDLKLEESAVSECSEDDETCPTPGANPTVAIATSESVQEMKGNKKSAEKRLGTAKQSPNTLFKVDANTNSAVRRSRRFSLTGSHAKKAAGTRNVSSTTLEAKLIAVSSEGGTVECYAKATIPRQSAAPAVSIQKSSKRWM